MHFEFTYTADDLKDLRRVHRKNASAKNKNAFGRGIIGWVVFVAAAALLVTVINWKPGGSGPPGPASPASVQDRFSSLIPFLPIPIFVVVLYAVVRYQQKSLKNDPALRRSNTMDIEADSINCRNGFLSSRWEWAAFDQFVETDLGFYLHVTDSKNWVVLPKRAIGDAETETSVRELFINNVHPSIVAFPVIPLRG